MRSLITALAASLVVLVPYGAHAAPSDPNVVIGVVPVQGNEQVTLSRTASKRSLALVTYAGYSVSIANNAASALNQVFVTATATNVGGSDPVNFSSAIGNATCTGVGTPQAHCSLPSLAPGTQSAPLVLVFEAPKTGSTIQLDWAAGGDEGNGGGNGCCNTTGTAETTLVDPSTNPDYLVKARTFVKVDGGTVFTGNEALTTANDGWSTEVLIPAFAGSGSSYAVASISEENQPTSCAPYAVADGCFTTELSIVDQNGNKTQFTAAPVEIAIRWDKSRFNLGSTKPKDVKLYYTPTDPGVNLPPALPWVALNLCAVDPQPAPAPGKPCLAEAPKKLSNQDTPYKDFWGDLLFRVLAIDNGKYAN